MQKIILKANEEGLGFVDAIISSDTPFGIPTNPRTSKKTPIDVSDEKTSEFDVKLYYLENQVRKVGYDFVKMQLEGGDFKK